MSPATPPTGSRCTCTPAILLRFPAEPGSGSSAFPTPGTGYVFVHCIEARLRAVPGFPKPASSAVPYPVGGCFLAKAEVGLDHREARERAGAWDRPRGAVSPLWWRFRGRTAPGAAWRRIQRGGFRPEAASASSSSIPGVFRPTPIRSWRMIPSIVGCGSHFELRWEAVHGSVRRSRHLPSDSLRDMFQPHGSPVRRRRVRRACPGTVCSST